MQNETSKHWELDIEVCNQLDQLDGHYGGIMIKFKGARWMPKHGQYSVTKFARLFQDEIIRSVSEWDSSIKSDSPEYSYVSFFVQDANQMAKLESFLKTLLSRYESEIIAKKT